MNHKDFQEMLASTDLSGLSILKNEEKTGSK
jgi:hypothetical protein